MEYLLFLNRFNLDVEKLIDKLKKLDKDLIYSEDVSGLIVNSKLKTEDFLKFQEISKVNTLFLDWKKFSFVSLKKDCLEFVRNFKITDYVIDVKFHDKVKISSKSLYKHINPYLKYESIIFNEFSNNSIYLEMKKFDSELKYRLSYNNKEFFNSKVLNVNMKNFVVVIENPSLTSEIGDFLRLCWIFKLQLYIITSDPKNFNRLLEKAKEETKGIDYGILKVTIIDSLPGNFLLVGFSKHSSKNEVDLKNVLLSDKKIAFVFGDDKFGLTQQTRDKLDLCFRLTPELKNH